MFGWSSVDLQVKKIDAHISSWLPPSPPDSNLQVKQGKVSIMYCFFIGFDQISFQDSQLILLFLIHLWTFQSCIPFRIVQSSKAFPSSLIHIFSLAAIEISHFVLSSIDCPLIFSVALELLAILRETVCKFLCLCCKDIFEWDEGWCYLPWWTSSMPVSGHPQITKDSCGAETPVSTSLVTSPWP